MIPNEAAVFLAAVCIAYLAVQYEVSVQPIAYPLSKEKVSSSFFANAAPLPLLITSSYLTRLGYFIFLSMSQMYYESLTALRLRQLRAWSMALLQCCRIGRRQMRRAFDHQSEPMLRSSACMCDLFIDWALESSHNGWHSSVTFNSLRLALNTAEQRPPLIS